MSKSAQQGRMSRAYANELVCSQYCDIAEVMAYAHGMPAHLCIPNTVYLRYMTLTLGNVIEVYC